jgi:HK97 family phage prohead protease
MTELRFLNLFSTPDSKIISGTAIVFNQRSNLMNNQFYEIIKPEAITRELINSSDIFFRFEKDINRIPLARCKRGKGTLSISIDSSKVSFSFRAKDTKQGNEILQAVRCGDLTNCSFTYRVAEGGEKWQQLTNGKYLRTITKIKSLHDFNIVVNPDYDSATVNLRGLQELIENYDIPIENDNLTQGQRNMKNYFEKIKRITNQF